MSETDNAKCPSCGAEYDDGAIKAALMTCPACAYHYRMEPGDRIAYLADAGTFAEFGQDVQSQNPIAFQAYEEKLSVAEAKTSMKDAVVTGTCAIEGRRIVLALMSFSFMGGSMGSVVGEKICRAMQTSLDNRLPLVIYATSGGARMQEGVFSLMQMAKTSSMAAELDIAGVPYFVVLCDPTLGGVTASFAMLGDIIIAEPGALVGFAGERVIEGTIHEKLPEDFRRAEIVRNKGFADLIIRRQEQKKTLAYLIDLHTSDQNKSDQNKSGLHTDAGKQWKKS
ncbi:MAG: acetyl-CoA carboxylase, carboxyltransferase subunit beta [Spirochaetaceae bacterium]|jgi:acetyl-CoA carboxylase carboxyl transferase subunit beta|nr:acetyl-CoA carboxylase, carboxyltransferase subunit beta [Spirochaetaceae bacterium]